MTPLAIAGGLLVALLAGALLLPTLSDCVSLLTVFLGRAPTPRAGAPERPRLLVLIPAHNEELMIARIVFDLTAKKE